MNKINITSQDWFNLIGLNITFNVLRTEDKLWG